MNWLAVIVEAVAGLIVGFIWYAPQVFGRRWARASGIELPQPGEGATDDLPRWRHHGGRDGLRAGGPDRGAGSSDPGRRRDRRRRGLAGLRRDLARQRRLFRAAVDGVVGLNAGQAIVSLAIMGAIIGFLG